MTSGKPSYVSRLWRAGDDPEPEPRVGLSLRRIVAAAIELADEGGLDAVSMSRVAQRLGYTTMSLYRHVENKSELLAHMHDTAWQTPSALDDLGDDWRAGLVRWCMAMRSVLQEHPWLERVRVSERTGTPSHLAWLDRGLRPLAGTPLSEWAKTRILLVLNGYIFWEARAAADFAYAERMLDEPVSEVAAEYLAAMHTLADPVRFPALRRAVDGGAFSLQGPSYDFEADFTFGLDRFLDGVERLIDQQSSDTRESGGSPTPGSPTPGSPAHGGPVSEDPVSGDPASSKRG